MTRRVKNAMEFIDPRTNTNVIACALRIHVQAHEELWGLCIIAS